MVAVSTTVATKTKGKTQRRSFLSAMQTLPRLAALELISMLYQNDTHQLTARTDSSLGKELPKCGSDRTLRHSYFAQQSLLRMFRTPAAPGRRSCGDCCRHPIRLPASRSAEKLWTRALQIHSAWKGFLECRPAPCLAAQNSGG